MLYGTDFPHNVGDMPGILTLVRGLPDDQARKVAGDNAQADFQYLRFRARFRGAARPDPA